MTSHNLAAGLAVGLIIASGLHAQAVSDPATTTADSPPPTGEVIQLDPFTVSTEGADGYISKSTVAFGRVAMKLENVPQKIEIYNAQFIADIIPTTISDITRYSTAVDYNNSERNNGSTSLVRGFVASTRRNGENLGDLVGLAAVETIEQTEVVKGPSAVLYGASQPGGVINYVTKMPRFTPEYNATLQLHSLGGYTGMVDLTGPLGDPKRKGGPIAAYRLVVVDEDRDEYQDNSDFFKRQVLFGKLLFRPAPWLSLTLEAERSELSAAFFNSQLPLQSDYNASRAAPYTTSVPNPALVREPFFLPIGWTYQTEDTYREDISELYQATITLNKDFGRYGHWTLRSFYSLNNGVDINRDLVDVPNTSYPQAVTAADIGKVVNRNQTVTAADVTAGRLWIPRRSRRLITDRIDESARNQFDLTGQFDTGPVAHTLLLGTELNLGSKTRLSPFSNGNPGGTSRFAFEGAAGAAYATWVDNVDYQPIPVAWENVISPTNPTGTVRLQALAPGVVRDDIKFEIPYLTEKPTAFYIFDALSLMKDRLHVSIGLRHDEVSQLYRDTANVIQTANSDQWTKRFGAVFKLRDWLHLYGLYNESFSPNSSGALNAWRQPLAPQDGKQKEAGVRLSFLEDRLSVDASYFDITNSNVYQNDPFGKLPTRFPPGTDLSTIPDTVLWPNTPGLQNRGFDLQATLRLSSTTQVLASYTHNDMLATGTVTQQLALGSSTYKVNNVPDDHFSVWSKWTPKEGRLKGFSFNLGYRYVGDRPGGPVGNVAQIALGSYSMVDAAVGYTYKKWRVSLTIRNVLDEYAFRTATGADRLYPEKPVHAVLSISTNL